MKKLGEKHGSYTVTGIKNIVHGALFPNKNMVQVVALKGKRGAKATAFVNKAGEVGTLRRDYGYFEGTEILDGRKNFK